MMAFHNNYMVPMFSIPQVTWANQSAGQTSLGRFPNPNSVMKICKFGDMVRHFDTNQSGIKPFFL